MNRWLSTVLVACVAAGLGWLAALRFAPESPPAGAPGEGPCPGGAQPLYWKAPMDPTFVRDAPGKSPMGMDLVPECPAVGGASAGGDEIGVRVDPGIVQSIGVRTRPVERRDLARKIRAVARVDYDEHLVTHVHTKVQGWVEKLHVNYEGQLVERGEPLLEIYSPELVSTQEELLVAERYREATGRSGFEDVSRGGEALLRATRRRLELWDIPERDIERLLETGEVRKTLTLYAPRSGVVTRLMVREGTEVGPSDNLYTVADLSRVWLHADVYEYELPWVAVGQRAQVELSYQPGARFEAEVTYVYPYLDPKTRTARVRLELANPDLVLKPDMFADVTLETAAQVGAIAVPEEAVIRSGTRTLVIVALGAGRFEPREVEIGMDSGDGWLEVTDGVVPGMHVVTSGQFLIDSESRLKAAVESLLGAGEGAPADPHAGHGAEE